jgi:NAD(P)-dependent dehydrogenase (short-subunit alcohol dehydrogenase family)
MEPIRTYIVTGGNTGLGYQCSRFLGANPENLVVIACRDTSRGEQAAENLRRIGCRVKVLPLDLASLASVRQFLEEFRRAALPPLAGIVCNAGLQNIGPPTKTADGYEATFGVNHLAHYLLTRLLLSDLQARGHIVFVSSGTHDPNEKTGLPEPRYTSARDLASDLEPGADAGRRRNTTSKLCNLYCTYEFTCRLASSSDARLQSIRVSAFDPGMMPGTGLARSYPALLRFIWNYILPAFALFKRNVHRPAKSGRRLAGLVSDSSEMIAGKYYSNGREARSSALSYNKLNAAELWDASADMVGLPRSIV